MNKRLCRHDRDRATGGAMSACNFNRLWQLVNKQLDLDGLLETYNHLDRCDICRDAIYQLARERDRAFFFYRDQMILRARRYASG
jgi:predicted anti-sigma-YlaC factor YlaD